jgi:hypothetical protein
MGYSSGTAIKVVQEVAAAKLPRGYDIDLVYLQMRWHKTKRLGVLNLFRLCLLSSSGSV